MARKGYSLLLVDDDRFLIDMYSMKFKEHGHDVTPALSGAEALSKLREGYDPQVILFDIVMPGIDGFEFLEAMTKERLAPRALKIALTNQGQAGDIEKAKSLGAAGYIVKANAIPSEVLAQVSDMVHKHADA